MAATCGVVGLACGSGALRGWRGEREAAKERRREGKKARWLRFVKKRMWADEKFAVWDVLEWFWGFSGGFVWSY
jgi:hypothetical protein